MSQLTNLVAFLAIAEGLNFKISRGASPRTPPSKSSRFALASPPNHKIAPRSLDYCAVGDTSRHQYDSSQSETKETTIDVSLPNVFLAFTQTRISSFLKTLFRQDKTIQEFIFHYINHSSLLCSNSLC